MKNHVLRLSKNIQEERKPLAKWKLQQTKHTKLIKGDITKCLVLTCQKILFNIASGPNSVQLRPLRYLTYSNTLKSIFFSEETPVLWQEKAFHWQQLLVPTLRHHHIPACCHFSPAQPSDLDQLWAFIAKCTLVRVWHPGKGEGLGTNRSARSLVSAKP